MKILIWIIVALVIVGGLAWFMSSDPTSTLTNDGQEQDNLQQITESTSIESDDEVFTEIDQALAELD